MKIWISLMSAIFSMSISATVTDIQESLTELVNTQVSENKLVGMAVSVAYQGDVLAQAVTGERVNKSNNLLSFDDKWHIGSVTKSVTATLMARLVDKNVLSWDTTISEVFTDFDSIDEQWKDVSLHQLLTHTSGAPANFPLLMNLNNPSEGAERAQARLEAVQYMLQKPPKHAAGSKFLYSNVGYTIAGLIAEIKTGKTWENLIREEIFTPLHISSGGFGPPQDGGDEVEQPRGHRKGLFGTKTSVGPVADNSSIMGPAGIIHLALPDLIKYVDEHRLGAVGKGTLLPQASYQRLHTPELDDYAYGWVVFKEREWAQGPVIWHNGSNTMWYTFIAYMPKLNMSIAIVSNDGEISKVEASALEITKTMAEKIAVINSK